MAPQIQTMDQRSNHELSGNPGASPRSVPLARADGNRLAPEVQPRQRWLSLIICLLLALAAWAVFGQTLRYGFVNYDDDQYIYENLVVQRGLTLDGIGWAFTHAVVNNWHPLTVMSYMVDASLYGLKPGGYHLTNVLLHTGAVILLFVVLKEMTGTLWRSAFVAAVFAIHPLRAESVAWVAERKDVLSGVFFMLTLWAYARYVHQPAAPVSASTLHPESVRPSRFTFHVSRYYWLAVVFFAFGLMSKPMLVTLPFVLLLLDYWPLGRFTPAFHVGVQRLNALPRHPMSGFTLKHLLVEKIPFFILSAAACAVTLVTQREIIADLPLSLRIGNALVSGVVYLRQMLWPANLAVLYPFPEHGLPFLGDRRFGRAAGLDFRRRFPVAGQTALVPGGVVMVSGNVGAGDRPGAIRLAGSCGPLHLSAANRIGSGGGVGRGGSVQFLALAEGGAGVGRRGGVRGPDGTRLCPNRILARQHNALDAHTGLHA